MGSSLVTEFSMQMVIYGQRRGPCYVLNFTSNEFQISMFSKITYPRWLLYFQKMGRPLISWNGGTDLHWMRALNTCLGKVSSHSSIQKQIHFSSILIVDFICSSILDDTENSINQISYGAVLANLLSQGIHAIHGNPKQVYRAFCRTCTISM